MPLAQKPVNSPFGARSTASEVLAGIDLTGKTAIVTGASAGIGVETARALAKAGASVIMPVRNPEKGEKVAAELRASTGNPNITATAMDLEDYPGVRAFTQAFLATEKPLDILINNAGIMACPERRIAGGFESQFGTNHLGHMLLTCRLAPALLKAKKARVVELSSVGHRRSPINFDDPNFENHPYEKWEAYGQAKTANCLFAVELNRRLEPKGVTAYAVHPGGIMTELQRDLSHEEMKAFGWIDDNGKINDRFKSTAQGAATSVWAATSPLLAGGGGFYCEDCDVAQAVPAEDPSFTGVRPWAIDPDAAHKLWAMSEKMLQEEFAV
ncbi:MAG TPA: oxidoreductase [Rhizomicrobium sp.]|jgi:NAD(P)-dependent dehydrogenase (short-subunit alcohol dehydrogenase family)